MVFKKPLRPCVLDSLNIKRVNPYLLFYNVYVVCKDCNHSFDQFWVVGVYRFKCESFQQVFVVHVLTFGANMLRYKQSSL